MKHLILLLALILPLQGCVGLIGAIGEGIYEGVSNRQYNPKPEDINQDRRKAIKKAEEYCAEYWPDKEIEAYDDCVNRRLPWMAGVEEDQADIRKQSIMFPAAIR